MHVETVLLSQREVKDKATVVIDDLKPTKVEMKPTYDEIRKYVFDKYGVNVSSLNIAKAKTEFGVKERENYNLPKSDNPRQPNLTPEKKKTIKEAFDIQDGFIQVTIPFNKKVMKNRGTLNGTLNGTLKNDNLTANELTLLGTLLSNPSISLSDAGDRMGISRRTASRIVASLQDKGIVERKGSKKQGSWKIVK